MNRDGLDRNLPLSHESYRMGGIVRIEVCIPPVAVLEQYSKNGGPLYSKDNGYRCFKSGNARRAERF